MTRAVIYLRSKRGSLPERGIMMQRLDCRRHAQALGAEIVAEFYDVDESANNRRRGGLRALMRFLSENRGVNYVIVQQLDRLTRRYVDYAQLVRALREYGTDLVTCDGCVAATSAPVHPDRQDRTAA